MYPDNKLKKRIVLPDRIQLTVTPEYKDIIDLPFEKDHTAFKLKDKKIEKLGNSKYVKLKYDLFPKYVSDVKIGVDKPYAVLLNLNFIRYMKEKLQSANPLFYDSNYDKNIRLNDTNYINQGICQFTSKDAYNYIEDITKIACNIAKKVALIVYPIKLQNGYIQEINYENVSIRQIEINQDYYVGHNQSDKYIVDFRNFLFSDNGDAWIKKCVKAIRCKSKFENTNEISTIEGSGFHSFQFKIAGGTYLKVYRKTTDHIRLEITYYTRALNRKLNSRSFEQFNYLFCETKQLINRINLMQILKQLPNNRLSNIYDRQRDILIDIAEAINPELPNIINSMIYDNTVDSPEGIRFIRNNPELKKMFLPVLTDIGKRVYRFDPNTASEIREIKQNLGKQINKIDAHGKRERTSWKVYDLQ